MPVPHLVALSAAGDEFVAALTAAWDAGDPVLPVDPRLPSSARETLLAALRAGDDVEPGDALVVATSGTTGEPKGAVLTHDALASGARATNRRLAVDPAHDRWLACLPLAHVGGLGVVVRALLSGTPVVVRHDRPARRGCRRRLVRPGRRDAACASSAACARRDPAGAVCAADERADWWRERLARAGLELGAAIA
jgi:acyl-CoA synthetase (AMP-forming)/AMP-acid ligase II